MFYGLILYNLFSTKTICFSEITAMNPKAIFGKNSAASYGVFFSYA